MKEFLRMEIRKYMSWIFVIIVLLIGTACEKDTPAVDGTCENCPDLDRISGIYDPKPYDLELPTWIGKPVIPADNPLTEEGVALGRMLFYDPILSSDSSLSCASCHVQALGFTDGLDFSSGVNAQQGKRSSMPLMNLVFSQGPFFWDGRSPSLEDQALHPVMSDIELNEDWKN